MNELERKIVTVLKDPLYTIEFLENWTDRDDNVLINAPAALQAVGAKSYYRAIQQIARCCKEGKVDFHDEEQLYMQISIPVYPSDGIESLDELAIDLLEVAGDNVFSIESIKIGNQPYFEVKKGFFNVDLKELIKQEGDD